MDLAIMIEGQNGLNWPRWQRIVRAVEDLGFAGLYRSDHFTNMNPPDLDSLELWVSLTWLAIHTTRLEFGPLATPVSFRHPTLTARMARDVDDLSGGRLHLGVGAGWQEREHNHFGHPLLDVKARMDRFEEGLEVMSRLLRSDAPVSFEGTYFTLREAILLPRPARPGGPPILVGGNGERRTLRLAARYASMWNGVFATPAEYRRLNQLLDQYLIEAGRQPGEVHRSLMTGIVFARDDAGVQRKLTERGRSAAEQRARGVIVGTAGAAVNQLGELAAAGCQRVMLQWLDLDDLDGLEVLARDVLPHYQ